MFKSVNELQAFLTWAKDLKLKSVRIGDIQADFSELAFLPESDLKEISSGGASTLAESEPASKEDDEELAFWSAQ